jgi:lipopolysaccharide/colanic/teichoic acid biosynthesis glycosyltransferase
MLKESQAATPAGSAFPVQPIETSAIGPSSAYLPVKRAFDFVVALMALIVLSPLMLLIATWIRLGSRGPILYRAPRVARGGGTFTMLKFRTMVVDADRGASSTGADDPRITTVGKLLRRVKMDELPQFINVLRGEMSFVGPRPQVRWAVDLYTQSERHILSVRPGITDYASLKYRNEGEILKGSTDPDKDYLEKIAPGKSKLALMYIHNMSLPVDVKIITATALSVFGVDPEWCLPPEGKAL